MVLVTTHVTHAAMLIVIVAQVVLQVGEDINQVQDVTVQLVDMKNMFLHAEHVTIHVKHAPHHQLDAQVAYHHTKDHILHTHVHALQDGMIQEQLNAKLAIILVEHVQVLLPVADHVLQALIEIMYHIHAHVKQDIMILEMLYVLNVTLVVINVLVQPLDVQNVPHHGIDIYLVQLVYAKIDITK